MFRGRIEDQQGALSSRNGQPKMGTQHLLGAVVGTQHHGCPPWCQQCPFSQSAVERCEGPGPVGNGVYRSLFGHGQTEAVVGSLCGCVKSNMKGKAMLLQQHSRCPGLLEADGKQNVLASDPTSMTEENDATHGYSSLMTVRIQGRRPAVTLTSQ